MNDSNADDPVESPECSGREMNDSNADDPIESPECSGREMNDSIADDPVESPRVQESESEEEYENLASQIMGLIFGLLMMNHQTETEEIETKTPPPGDEETKVETVKSYDCSNEEIRAKGVDLMNDYVRTGAKLGVDSIMNMNMHIKSKDGIDIAKWAYEMLFNSPDLSSFSHHLRQIHIFWDSVTEKYDGMHQFEEYFKGSVMIEQGRKHLMEIQPLDVAIYYVREYDRRNPGEEKEYWESNNRPKSYGMIFILFL